MEVSNAVISWMYILQGSMQVISEYVFLNQGLREQGYSEKFMCKCPYMRFISYRTWDLPQIEYISWHKTMYGQFLTIHDIGTNIVRSVSFSFLESI
jgi:hypothetical protein